MTTAIKEFYDKNCKDYEQHMINTGHYAAQNRIIKKLNSYFKDPILDLACGTGYLLSLLLQNHRNVECNDFSKEMCKIAIQKFPKIKLTNKNAENLISFKKYNTIICCNLFYYIQDYKKTLKNWDKMLKNNGKIIIIEEYPFINNNINKNKKISKELNKLINPITPKEINTILNKNNFKLIKIFKTKIDNKHKLFGFIFEKVK